MGIDIDKRLTALAGCPVIQQEGGGMLFDPHPVIYAENDLVLAHEICHVLSGKRNYDIFNTACQARKNPLYTLVLNFLYDWFDEYYFSHHSLFLRGKIEAFHEANIKLSRDKTTKELLGLYNNETPPESLGIKDALDLVILADKFIEELPKVEIAQLQVLLSALAGGARDIGTAPKKSAYYFMVISKYSHIIHELTKLWKRNKYCWLNHYYGEIDWKNLPGMFTGEKLTLPVWRIFSKVGISRRVFLIIDRSGSTKEIKNIIMDTAVIIAESLRLQGVPISILDVGVTNDVVNHVEEPLDLSWFTPMADGTTPLGEVCAKIAGADGNSYCLIVTDGIPNSWKVLASSISRFPGQVLTFVIGNAWLEYAAKIGSSIQVEPNTIIRELLHESTLAS